MGKVTVLVLNDPGRPIEAGTEIISALQEILAAQEIVPADPAIMVLNLPQKPDLSCDLILKSPRERHPKPPKCLPRQKKFQQNHSAISGSIQRIQIGRRGGHRR